MRSINIKTLLITAVSAIALAAIFAPVASAGSYKVYSCKLPNGNAAPVDGWAASATSIQWSGYNNNCATGGSMQLYLGNAITHPVGNTLTWTFDPGDGRKILAYDVWRSGTADGLTTGGGGGATATFRSFVNSSSGVSYRDWCSTFSGCRNAGLTADGDADTNKISATGLDVPVNTTSFGIAGGCTGVTGFSCTADTARPLSAGYIHKAAFVIADDDLPTASSPTGSLVGGGELSGVAGVNFNAQDVGAGIYRAQIEIDGVVASGAVTPNDNGGKCVTNGSEPTMNDFVHVEPCPLSTPVSVNVDTTAYTDGVRSVRVRVFDAAGNGTTVFGPQSVTFKNAASSPGGGGSAGNNGSGGNLTTARFSSSTKGIIKAKYGQKKVINNRLTDAAGSPIVGAHVDVYEHVNVAGSVATKKATLVSDAQGWVSYAPRTTATKVVSLSWAAQRGSSTYNATDNTTVIVSGSVRLRSAKRSVRSFGKMTLRGRVFGEDMPRRVPVEILARDGRKWRVIAVVNTKTHGKFSFSHRFKYTKRGKFNFRARVRGSSDLSVEPASSKVVKIRVG